MPDYEKIWGSNASQPAYEFSDAEYQKGWESVGNTPPARTMFDKLQQLNDQKAKDLNDRIVPIESNTSRDYRQPNTAYTVGTIKYHHSLPTGYYLECTTQGTTSSGDLSISSEAEGDTVTDGTVTWTIVNGALQSSSFGTAIVNHLLGSTLASLVDAVSTDSLFSKLLKKALEAAGLQYNIGSNGYICFGALFGGLILQWGEGTGSAYRVDTYFPLTFPNDTLRVVGVQRGDYSFYLLSFSLRAATWTKSTTGSSGTVNFIAIGY